MEFFVHVDSKQEFRQLKRHFEVVVDRSRVFSYCLVILNLSYIIYLYLHLGFNQKCENTEKRRNKEIYCIKNTVYVMHFFIHKIL